MILPRKKRCSMFIGIFLLFGFLPGTPCVFFQDSIEPGLFPSAARVEVSGHARRDIEGQGEPARRCPPGEPWPESFRQSAVGDDGEVEPRTGTDSPASLSPLATPLAASLAASLGLGGGIEDIDYLLELLGPEAGREEVALAVRLLGYNRDLGLFPAAVVDRILVEHDFARSRAGALLLDLGLKILCSTSRENSSGVSAARLGIEVVLEAYEGLYDRLGEALHPITWTISRSGILTAGDMKRLLRLALSVPGVEGLVRAAARDLGDSDPAWAERNLFEGEDNLAEGLPPAATGILREAALDQLAPLDALDYLAGRDAERFEGSSPPCPPARRGTLRRIVGRADDDELFRWFRSHPGSDTSSLLVSVLSTRAHASLLERLVRSGSIEARLRGGAIVKLAGARADEEIAGRVLWLLEGSWPGRRDLFVQAAENLLSGSGPGEPWMARISLRLSGLLERCRDELSPVVKDDLRRVLSRYRARSG